MRFVRVEVSIGTASGTWFGEIPVCCCLTGSAWLCLDVSPNHVPEAMRVRHCAILKELGLMGRRFFCVDDRKIDKWKGELE